MGNTDTFEEVLKRVKTLANSTGEKQMIENEEKQWMEVEPDIVLWRRWGIPKLYTICGFETFRGNDKVVTAIKTAAMKKNHIVLIGGTGCGKTHLAISALKEYGGHYKGFCPTQEVLLNIRESFRPNSKESEADIIDQYTEYDVLVLDDLGAEKTSEYSITTLYLIIDRRLRDCMPTIITTNLTLTEIEEKLSARIASRLSAMTVFKINMPDYRKKR